MINSLKNAKNIVFFGAPGSGKGTQSEFLKQRGFFHLSTGDLLRDVSKNEKHPLFSEVSACMKSGSLVSDDIINDIVKIKVSEISNCGIIFDGYPRTLDQAKFLASTLAGSGSKIHGAIFFDIADDIVVSRLLSRRVCTECKSIMNASNSQCTKCGGTLKTRDDDNEETIRNRMKIFRETVNPLLDFYKNVLASIDASQSPDDISLEIAKAVDSINIA